MMHGIDVSNYQGTLDFEAVPMDFVLIKATGGPGPRYVNPIWALQSDAATSVGIHRQGLYHFSGDGWLYTDPITEADHFIRTVASKQAGKILVLDFESSSPPNPWPTNDANWAMLFLRRVEAAFGRKPMIYANGQALGNPGLRSIRDAGYQLWHAYYTDRPMPVGYVPDVGRPGANHWGQGLMWQFTQKGRLPGYGGDLDLNRFYGEPSDWDALAGGSGTALIPGVSGLGIECRL